MYFNNVIRKTLRSGYEKNIEIASEAQKEKSTKILNLVYIPEVQYIKRQCLRFNLPKSVIYLVEITVQ